MKFTARLAKGVTRILYDWDGTLMKFRAEQFLDSMNRTLDACGRQQLKSLEGSKSIRHTLRTEEALAIFRTDFSKHPLSRNNLIPGAEDIIKMAQDYGLEQGIVSNLDHELLTSEVERLGLSDYFSVVIGSRNDKHLKPNPDLIIKALDMMQAAPNKSVLYIGDTKGDIAAANAAGCRSILVSEQEETNADVTTPNLNELRRSIEDEIIRTSMAQISRSY